MVVAARGSAPARRAARSGLGGARNGLLCAARGVGAQGSPAPPPRPAPLRCAGREHHGVLQGVQRGHAGQGRHHHPRGDHRVRGAPCPPAPPARRVLKRGAFPQRRGGCQQPERAYVATGEREGRAGGTWREPSTGDALGGAGGRSGQASGAKSALPCMASPWRLPLRL